MLKYTYLLLEMDKIGYCLLKIDSEIEFKSLSKLVRESLQLKVKI